MSGVGGGRPGDAVARVFPAGMSQHLPAAPWPPPYPPSPNAPRYKEVVENVFRYKDSKEKQIRRAVIHLLPRMAAFSPERFASGG